MQNPAHETTTASTLQIKSKQLKNARFRNKIPHNYALRSRTQILANQGTNFRHQAVQHLTAESVFQQKANHIFTVDGKNKLLTLF